MSKLALLTAQSSALVMHELNAIQKQSFTPCWSESQIQQQLAGEKNLNFALLKTPGELGSGDSKCKLLGFIFYRLLFDEAEVLQIAVSPDYQHQGIGRALITKSKKHLIEQDVGRVMLEVNASNLHAIELYEKMDFVLEGTRKRYYPSKVANGERGDALLYSLSLAAVKKSD
ncbi:MAG: ribosomal protein S18-alanine N-acetyltransferase [Oceanospirillaceae bacterium]